LDAEPSQRWNTLAKSKAAGMRNLLDKFKSFLREWSEATKYVIDFIDKDLGYLADTFPAPFGDEIKGIAKASGIPLGEVVLYNIFYEVFTVCTSVVAEDPTGKMYHARNLDFGLFLGWSAKNHSWVITDALRQIIVNLEFQKGGKTVFKSVNFAGYVGIFTGIKPGTFTLTMNERFNKDGGFIGIMEWILGSRNIQWMGFLTRNTLEYAQNYTDAKQRLTYTPMLAPAYYILGGTKHGEACVITRSRDKALDVWDIGTRNSSWYILETNYDHWEAPLFLDDRRTPAHHCMNKLTQKNVNFAGIFDVLSSKPVLNKLTTYSALMQVDSGRLETYLQYCPDPCIPW